MPRRSDATPRSVPSGRSKGVRWRDSAGSDDNPRAELPCRRATGRYAAARASPRTCIARGPPRRTRERTAIPGRGAAGRGRASRSAAPWTSAIEMRRDIARHAVSSIRAPADARARRGGQSRCEIDMFLAWVRDLYETTSPRTFLVFGAALAVVLVSRSSVSAAISLAGAFASLAAIGAAIGAEERLANVSRTLSSLSPATAARRLAPALEAARVLLGWLEASASAAVVFAAGLFTTLAAALVDAAREFSRRRDLFLKSVEEKRRATKTAPRRRRRAARGRRRRRRRTPPRARIRRGSRASSFPDGTDEGRGDEKNETAQDTHTPKRTPKGRLT